MARHGPPDRGRSGPQLGVGMESGNFGLTAYTWRLVLGDLYLAAATRWLLFGARYLAPPPKSILMRLICKKRPDEPSPLKYQAAAAAIVSFATFAQRTPVATDLR